MCLFGIMRFDGRYAVTFFSSTKPRIDFDLRSGVGDVSLFAR